MNSRAIIYRVARRLIPRAVRRHVSALRNSRQVYNFYFKRQTRSILPVLLATGETHNFTYDLTDRNIRYLSETIACVTQRPPSEISAYIDEAISDRDLKQHALAAALISRPTLRCPFGRRLGWYAIARATKPKIIVETGVERGHGALILCSALLRNAIEGHPGRYYGTDIDPTAGTLLTGKYAEVGKILYGDSIGSLTSLAETVDLFISDSDHSEEYEFAEYMIIADKLSPDAIILGDNAHVTDKLAVFSRLHTRRFLFFHEEPRDHWYPGAGIGISYR